MDVYRRDLYIIVCGSLTKNNAYGIMSRSIKTHFFGNILPCEKDTRFFASLCVKCVEFALYYIVNSYYPFMNGKMWEM